jgi:cytochrome c553
VLGGQSPEYLERALRNYASGDRRSGIMQPVVAELDGDAIGELARYYSGLQPVQANVAVRASEEQIRRGQDIATLGIASKGVPACLTCHAGSAPSFPKLAGQHAAYVVSQLELWRRGLRSDTVHGAIMAPIALRLSAEQAADVAAFFESVGRGSTAASTSRHPEEGSGDAKDR